MPSQVCMWNDWCVLNGITAKAEINSIIPRLVWEFVCSSFLLVLLFNIFCNIFPVQGLYWCDHWPSCHHNICAPRPLSSSDRNSQNSYRAIDADFIGLVALAHNHWWFYSVSKEQPAETGGWAFVAFIAGSLIPITVYSCCSSFNDFLIHINEFKEGTSCMISFLGGQNS